jgi:hypothetical protein
MKYYVEWVLPSGQLNKTGLMDKQDAEWIEFLLVFYLNLEKVEVKQEPTS